MAKKHTKPTPIAKHVVCSLCGLEWDKHKKKMQTSDETPSPLTCVDLLKAELAKRSLVRQQFAATSGVPFYGNLTTQ